MEGAFAYHMLHVFLPLLLLVYIGHNLLSENNMKNSGHVEVVI